MSVRLGDIINIGFTTHSTTTGNATDADSTPDCNVFEDATDAAILTPTVTKRTGHTGVYRCEVECSTGNGFEEGKSYTIEAEATVGGVAQKSIRAQFVLNDLHHYQVQVVVFVDTSEDTYGVVFHKDAEPIVTGITVPKIQVIKVADAADLIAEDDLTQVGATGLWKYDETSNRIVGGSAYMAKITATIDGGSRTWYRPVGRDV